jgi:hypothetical protein
MPVHEYLMNARHDDRLRSAAQLRLGRQLRDLARASPRAAQANQRITRSLKLSRPAVLPA